jgi:hypothetical protein
MVREREHEPERVAERAELLPEERAAGSADEDGQAEAILAESEERAAEAERDTRTGQEPIERRRSGETA